MSETQKPTPLAQMSLKNIGANPKDAIKQDKTVFMGRIRGEATAIKTKEARTGDAYSYLIGAFLGTNDKGESFESDTLFLPGTILEKIESHLVAAEGKPVKFAYDIFCSPDEKVGVGFRYSVRNLVKTEATDRLAALEAELEAAPLPGHEPKPAEAKPEPAKTEPAKPAEHKPATKK